MEGSRTPGIPSSTAPHRVEARKRGHSSRGGRRGRTVNAIHRTAQERQTAWAETDQPNLTFQLTSELDGLYGDLRDERKGDPGQPFRGVTSAVRS